MIGAASAQNAEYASEHDGGKRAFSSSSLAWKIAENANPPPRTRIIGSDGMAIGQGRATSMSAFGGKADISSESPDVRF
jgi:hypothetical protein